MKLSRWKPAEMNAASEEGGSLVEFALVLPLTMALILGMFTFGVALSNYMVLTNAVASGARAFAISPAVTITTGSGSTQSITDPCAYAIQMANLAAPTLKTSNITYTVTYTPASPSGSKSTTYTSGSCSGISTAVGDTVQLQGSYPYTLLLYGYAPSTLNLQARSAELVQ